jgi:SPP1 gp7 family putative phage head morphogenesis protein
MTYDEAVTFSTLQDPNFAKQLAMDLVQATVAEGLSDQQQRLLKWLDTTKYAPTSKQASGFWGAESQYFWKQVQPSFLDVAAMHAAMTMAKADPAGDAATWAAVAEEASAYVTQYYTLSTNVGSIPSLTQTSRLKFEEKFQKWLHGDLPTQLAKPSIIQVTGGTGLPDLVEALIPVFGKTRADAIAATETTRIVTEAQRLADQHIQEIVGYRLVTAADELVCPICGPLNGVTRMKKILTYKHPSLGEIAGPPFHPRCRCQEISETTLSLQPPTAKQVPSALLQPGAPPAAPTKPAPAPVTPVPVAPAPAPPAPVTPAPVAPAPAPPTKPRPRRTPKPPPKPTPTPVAPSTGSVTGPMRTFEVPAGFPTDPAALKVIRPLGGSTGAVLVEDAAGVRYVRKTGASPAHLLEEAYADRAYRDLGINVPEFAIYNVGEKGQVKLARYLENTTPLNEIRRTDQAAYAKVVQKLREGYAADALLANWDVLGADFDNILVDAEGTPWRVDNGGSFRFRAQGGTKAKLAAERKDPRLGLTGEVWDLWSLRDPKFANNAEVYGKATLFDVGREWAKYGGSRTALLQGLPEDLREVVTQRFDNLSHMAKIGRDFEADGFKVSYADTFARATQTLREAKIVDKLPVALESRFDPSDQWVVRDDQGALWDALRRTGRRKSVVEELATVMADNGGDHTVIEHWAISQSGGSWSLQSQAAKLWYARQRTDLVLEDDLFWQNGVKGAEHNLRSQYNYVGQDKYETTLSLWHAFNYELMTKTDFPGNDRAAGTVRLFRSEEKKIMTDAGFTIGSWKAGQKPKGVYESGIMRRGGLESTSIFEDIYVTGSELTIQDVPHHRIFGTYFTEKTPGANDAGYLSNGENEFLAMLDGITTHYVGDARTGKAVSPKNFTNWQTP